MIDRRVPLLLLGCAVSAAAIAVELRTGNDGRVATAAVPIGAANGALSTDFRPQPDRSMPAILARPLFSPTRRPPPRTGAQAFDLSDKRLAGIVIAPTGRIAIFAGAGAKPLVLSIGGSLNGWEIESIKADEVVLRGPAGIRTLRPKMDQTFPRRSSPPSFASERPTPPPAPSVRPVIRTNPTPVSRRTIMGRRR
jgi:hypothetical protein